MGRYIAHKRRKIKRTKGDARTDGAAASAVRGRETALQREAERLELERARAVKQARALERPMKRQEFVVDRTTVRAAGFALILATVGLGTLSISIDRVQARAMAGVAHDLLDRGSNFGLGEDGGVGFLSTHMPFILKELSGGEEFRVDGRGADRSADLAHRFAHGVEESMTGVLHQIPTIGDLDCLWKRLGGGQRITVATISGHDFGLQLSRKPFDSVRL